jgi:hypothetical protein
LQNNSVYFSAAFIPFSIIAFGYNFFLRDLSSFVTVHHLHGIAIFVWLFILVAQASPIRTKRKSLHRLLGKASYTSVPFIPVTTVLLSDYVFCARLGTPAGSLILALQLFLLLQLLIIYSCAIKYRKVSEVHGR